MTYFESKEANKTIVVTKQSKLKTPFIHVKTNSVEKSDSFKIFLAKTVQDMQK